MGRQLNFAAAQLQRSGLNFFSAQFALLRADVQGMTKAVAAAHHLRFPFKKSLFKSGFRNFSAVKSIELEGLCVHHIAVVIQFFTGNTAEASPLA